MKDKEFTSAVLFKKNFLAQVLMILRRQWQALGAPLPDSGKAIQCVDPEALLIATASFGRYDAILFDMALKWLDIHGNLVNIQRLRNLLKNWPNAEVDEDRRVLGAVAQRLVALKKDIKWRGLVRTNKTTTTESLFYNIADQNVPAFKAADPVFLEYGFKRGPIRSKACAETIPLTGNPSLVLRLRALFGVNIRSELVLWLLSHPSGYPRSIARELSFSQKAVQDTLLDMSRSGLVRISRRGREKHYWIEMERWNMFLGPLESPLRWTNWRLVFRAMKRAWQTVTGECLVPGDISVSSAKIAECLESVQNDLESAGFRQLLSDRRKHQESNDLAILIRDVNALMVYLVRD